MFNLWIKILCILFIVHNCFLCYHGKGNSKKSHRKWERTFNFGKYRIPPRKGLQKFPTISIIEIVNYPKSYPSCQTKILNSHEDCFEIGCTSGIKCRRQYSSDSICCPYIFNKKNVTCCRGILKCKSHIKGCPALEIPRNFNCMEFGCTLGQVCKTRGLENRICCYHIIRGLKITCCLSEPNLDVSNLIQNSDLKCLNFELPLLHHCLQIGCRVGERCLNNKINQQKCCQYKFQRNSINCCLAVPYSGTEPVITKKKTSSSSRLPVKPWPPNLPLTLGPPPQLTSTPSLPSLPSDQQQGKQGQCPLRKIGGCPACHNDFDCPGVKKCCAKGPSMCCTNVRV